MLMIVDQAYCIYILKCFEINDVEKVSFVVNPLPIKFFVGQNLYHLVEILSLSVDKAFVEQLSILDVSGDPDYAFEAMKITLQNSKYRLERFFAQKR